MNAALDVVIPDPRRDHLPSIAQALKLVQLSRESLQGTVRDEIGQPTCPKAMSTPCDLVEVFMRRLLVSTMGGGRTSAVHGGVKRWWIDKFRINHLAAGGQLDSSDMRGFLCI